MSSLSRTASLSLTFLEQVLRVTRPVQSDLLTLVDMYGHITETQARRYISDFRVLMDYEALTHIQFTWVRRGTNVVVDGLRYIVSNGEALRTQDRPGDIAFDPALRSADFSIRINQDYSVLNSFSLAERTALNKKLEFTWSSASSLNYSLGRFVSDKTYGEAAVGVDRQRFRRA